MQDDELRHHECPRAKRWELRDARGIFCCFVCDRCEEVKRLAYRPDIFTDANYWHSEPIDDY